MKSTGVVRRIDDLGRIVIPKELRRTLKIREGESLEIFIDRDTILLKKFSLMDDLTELSKNLIFAMQPLLKNCTISVTSLDQIVASSNINMEGKALTEEYLELLQKREPVLDVEKRCSLYESDEYQYLKLYPFIVNSDLVGGVVVSSKEQSILEQEEGHLQLFARFLEKNLEQ